MVAKNAANSLTACLTRLQRSHEVWRWQGYVAGEAEHHQSADCEPSNIGLTPAVTMFCGTGVSVMIVMPSLTIGEQSYDDVVAAVIGRLIIAIAPQMRDRID